MSAEEDLELLTERMDFEKASDMDDHLPDDEAADLALRKLVTTLGSHPDETDVGIVEATYRTVHVIDDLASRVSKLEDQLDKVDRAAETALTVAETEAKPGDSVSKKRVALLKSRNELIRAAALKNGGKVAGHSITVADVKDMAKPEVVLAYQTVKDAWDQLESDWTAFTVGENEAGNRVLRLQPNELDPALVKAVESSLDRDDLTKRLISREEREGV